MASAAYRVNIAPVNRRALRKYGEFWRALQMVGAAVTEAEKLAVKAREVEPGRGVGNWAVPTAEELRRASKKAGQALHVMSNSAKKWEAELISREWRR
ncbi:MAG: hypothetical protein M3Z25_16965 [Actinomycetota bacterium]|nr:hypothetical protein [Actinomycetota bacterium]